jgi:hypothetical protein
LAALLQAPAAVAAPPLASRQDHHFRGPLPPPPCWGRHTHPTAASTLQPSWRSCRWQEVVQVQPWRPPWPSLQLGPPAWAASSAGCSRQRPGRQTRNQIGWRRCCCPQLWALHRVVPLAQTLDVEWHLEHCRKPHSAAAAAAAAAARNLLLLALRLPVQPQPRWWSRWHQAPPRCPLAPNSRWRRAAVASIAAPAAHQHCPWWQSWQHLRRHGLGSRQGCCPQG